MEEAEASTPTFTHSGPVPLAPLTGTFATTPAGNPYQQYNGITLNPTRPDDTEEIRQLVNDFYSNRYSERELEAPAFSRHRVMLYEIPLLPDHELIRSRLFD